MVGSLPDGCTRLGRSAPEEDRLAKWNEEVNRTGGQRIGEEKYNAETLRTQRKAKQRKARAARRGRRDLQQQENTRRGHLKVAATLGEWLHFAL